MAAGPHSIDPTTYLDELLTQASPDLMRKMLQNFINRSGLSRPTRSVALITPPCPRAGLTPKTGDLHRYFDTRVGTVDNVVTKLRTGSFLPGWLLERLARAERSLTTVIATCYLKGVSTRRMNDLVATLGMNNLSKSQVSDIANNLDVTVEDFRTRPLDTGPYLYVSCEALAMKVRESGRGVKTSVLSATGVNAKGYRELLGM